MNVPESRRSFFLFAFFWGAVGMAAPALVFYRSSTGLEEVIGFAVLALLGAAVATAARGRAAGARK